MEIRSLVRLGVGVRLGVLAHQRHLIVEDRVEMLLYDAEGEAVGEVSASLSLLDDRPDDGDDIEDLQHQQCHHPEVEEDKDLLVHHVLREKTERVDLLDRSTRAEVEVVALGLRREDDRRVPGEGWHVVREKRDDGGKILEPEVVEHQIHQIHVEDLRAELSVTTNPATAE